MFRCGRPLFQKTLKEILYCDLLHLRTLLSLKEFLLHLGANPLRLLELSLPYEEVHMNEVDQREKTFG